LFSISFGEYLQVFQKLPISLDVLQTLKGVGKDVATLSRSDAFDEGEFFLLNLLENGGKMVRLAKWLFATNISHFQLCF
jgi:hypothetical protein